MNISPPLPPAEEPGDDVKGVYLRDGGTTPLIEEKKERQKP